MVRKTELWMPSGYRDLPASIKESVCNGCGSGGYGFLIPDNLLGCDISEACNIHDYMYEFARPVIGDKEKADRVFSNNMIRLVLDKGGWGWVVRLRLRLAWKYYQAVVKFGGPAFWDGKNDS